MIAYRPFPGVSRGSVRRAHAARRKGRMSHLRLDRPLVVFDLETTGVDPENDRIVEIAMLKIAPDGEREPRRRLINPERPIPAEASAVHGIRDEDVRDAPPFRRVARGVLDYLGDADLAGFNVLRFDVPLLSREMQRCGLDLGLERRRVIDAMTIYHRKERRDLTAAVAFFLGREHVGAHSALADVTATADVLEAQLVRYADLPREVGELDRWLRGVPEGAIDSAGRFVASEGRAVFAFGKFRGRGLDEIAREAPDYLEWLLGSDFAADAKALVREALDRARDPGGRGAPGYST